VRTKGCRARIKLKQTEEEAEILGFEAHDLESHNHLRDCESPQLSWEQKQAARAQAKMNPLVTVNEMRRNLERGGNEDEQIPFDKLRSMKRVVRKIRDEICEEYLGGIAFTGKIEELREICHGKSLAKAIREHNADPIKHHFDYHAVVCLSEKMIDGKEDLHASFSTGFLLMNACRAFNTPFGAGMHVDGAHKLCESDMCSCLMGFNELGNVFRLWLATTSSSESAAELRDTFEAGLKGVIVMLKCLLICGDPKCICCVDVLRIREADNTMQWMDTDGFKNLKSPDMPMSYATTDNMCSLADGLKDKSIDGFNQCAAHAGAIPKEKNLWLKYFCDFNEKTAQEYYDEWYEMYRLVIDLYEEWQVIFIHLKIQAWMVSNGQARAKRWWKRYWCGARGRSSLAYIPRGGCRSNSPIEGEVKQFKQGTQGSRGLTCGMKVGHYIVSFFQWLESHSKEVCCEMHKRPDGGFKFISQPRITQATWNSVELMHPLTMALATCTKNALEFNTNIQKMFHIPFGRAHHNVPLLERMRAMQQYLIVAFPEGIEKYGEIMHPSHRWFKINDPDRTRTFSNLSQKARDDQVIFMAARNREQMEIESVGWSAKECLDVFVRMDVITVKDFPHGDEGGLDCSCRNGHMCLMCGHIAVWHFLQGKAVVPPTCGKKKQSRDESATGADMIPKRKKVKPPGPGKEFPKRKAAKKRSETTFFADELCASEDDDDSVKDAGVPKLDSSGEDDACENVVIVVEDSPAVTQGLSKSQAQAATQAYEDTGDDPEILTQREAREGATTEDDASQEDIDYHGPVPDEKEAYEIALKEFESAREAADKQGRSAAAISRNAICNAAAAAAEKRAKIQEAEVAIVALKKAEAISDAAERVSVYAQQVQEQRKQRTEPARLRDVDPDAPLPEWAMNMRVSKDSGKRGGMMGQKRLAIFPDMAEVQPEIDGEEQFRDANRLIPQNEQRFRVAMVKEFKKKLPPPPRAKYTSKPGKAQQAAIRAAQQESDDESVDGSDDEETSEDEADKRIMGMRVPETVEAYDALIAECEHPDSRRAKQAPTERLERMRKMYSSPLPWSCWPLPVGVIMHIYSYQ